MQFTRNAGALVFLCFYNALRQGSQLGFGMLVLGDVANIQREHGAPQQADLGDGEFREKMAPIRSQRGHFDPAALNGTFYAGKTIDQAIFEPWFE